MENDPNKVTIAEIVAYVQEAMHREFELQEKIASKKHRTSPEIARLEARVRDLEEWRLRTISAETLGMSRIGDEHEDVLPVRYYVDTDDQTVADDIEHALEITLDEIGFRIAATYPIVKGSWFRKFFFASRGKLTPDQLAASLAKVERSLGVKTLDLPQSQVDLNRADGVAKLLTSLEKTDNALVQIGSILIIKNEGTPVVLNLTPNELSELEREPAVFRSPGDALSMVQKLRQKDKTSSSISHSTTQDVSLDR